MPKRLAIVGAGTVGLSVAYRAIEEFSDGLLDVTIIAAEFLQQTTSYGSGGLWEPYQIAGTPDELINTWGKKSFEHFKDLHYGRDGAAAGVQLVTSYQLLEVGQAMKEPSWRDIVFNFKYLNESDLQSMGIPRRFDKGLSFDTFVVDQKYYMQYLSKKLEQHGVRFKQQRLDSIQDVFADDHFDCVVNCTGLGATTVANDATMYPIRGQVLRVRAPWIKNCWFFGSNPVNYIIPNVDNIVLGGTANKGDWDTTVRKADTDMILNNISKLFPSIRDAPLEYAWVGLRPGRSPLRLEREMAAVFTTNPTAISADNYNSVGAATQQQQQQQQQQQVQIPVIHCYGHGGSGITLAMGCADDVVVNHIVPLLTSPSQGPATNCGASAYNGSSCSGNSNSSSDSSGQDASKLSVWMKYRARL